MKTTLTAMAVYATAGYSAFAQDAEDARRSILALECATELQTDLSHANWLNLLQVSIEIPILSALSIEAKSISTFKTRAESLLDDLQGFSNIEAENIPLTLATLSLDWETENTTLAVGVRNFNENYFATDLAGFFTQSSHGIFPTISANYPIANYPTASVGADFQWSLGEWVLDASLYNGIGHKDLFGGESVFRFRPDADGLFGAISLSHEAGYGNSHAGAALHNDCRKTRASFWAYAEVDLAKPLRLIAQYSISPSADAECAGYAGLGIAASVKSFEVGVAETFARFTDTNEWATEVTAQIPIGNFFSLQPAFHICKSGETQCAGLLRLVYSVSDIFVKK